MTYDDDKFQFRVVEDSVERNDPCRQVRKRRVFAHCRGIRRIHPNHHIAAYEQARHVSNQGHSIPVDVELPVVSPPDMLWHGTGEQLIPSII